jgi:two-component system LytT family response regulator
MRILIVDDEEPARRRLRTMLELTPRGDTLEVIGEAENGEQALEQIVALKPDVVFLDVQMPVMDGFAVADTMLRDDAVREALGDAAPAIVFVTAFDAHAVKAFDVHAVDYLLKPYDISRLATALDRAESRLGGRQLPSETPREADQLRQLLAAVRAGELGLRPAPTRFAVRVGERLYYVRAEDIDWIEAEGNYLRLHTGMGSPKPRSHLIRKTIAAITGELDPNRHARIHRSTIVNLDRIHEMRHLGDGEYQLVLVDGTRLKVSRTYRGNLPAL